MILKNCQLEWSETAGVLYVHNKDTGTTVVRVCNLPKLPCEMRSFEQIDVRAENEFSIIVGPKAK